MNDCSGCNLFKNQVLYKSAPELLSALEALLDMVTDNRLHGDEVYAAARVIAKAKGES